MFFYLSKILWFLVDPTNVFLLVLGVASLLALFKFRKIALILFIGVSAFAWGLAFVPIGNVMVQTLEERFPIPQTLPESIDGIVVLGGVIDPKQSNLRARISINDAVERLSELVVLSRRYPTAKVIFSGGSGDPFDQTNREAPFVKALLESWGVDTLNMIFEDAARNTVENAHFTKELAHPAAGEKWLLVTSAFHMPRSIGCFRQVGWEMIAYPVDFHTPVGASFSFGYQGLVGIGRFSSALHEWLGLVVYRLTGKSSEVFPAPH